MLLDSSRRSKVCDFGLARGKAINTVRFPFVDAPLHCADRCSKLNALAHDSLVSASAQMTGQCGTFQWMAPEVIANGKYTEKADIFSFGVIL